LTILEAGCGLGPPREEGAFGRPADRGGEVPPEVLGKKRHNGSDHANRLDEGVPECPERRLVEGVEALAGATDIPVGEIVGEPFPGARDVGGPEALERVGRLLDELLRTREQPAVERAELLQLW